tara:strand:- start:1379 stop:1591 length:213 start_codon:yes stop_codon:yes gene_type:complete
MIFTIIGIITAAFFFIIIMMTIIEDRIKNKQNEKILYNMEKVESANIREQRDKVKTRTGGLENDRLNERQ